MKAISSEIMVSFNSSHVNCNYCPHWRQIQLQATIQTDLDEPYCSAASVLSHYMLNIYHELQRKYYLIKKKQLKYQIKKKSWTENVIFKSQVRKLVQLMQLAQA